MRPRNYLSIITWFTSVWLFPGSARADDPKVDRDKTPRLVAQLGHSSGAGVNSVAFSPDGKQVLTGSDDKTARLWHAETGKELRTFTGHSRTVLSVAFSPNSKHVLTGSGDKTARFWDMESGNELRRFTGHDDEVRSVAFSPDGNYVLTGSWDKTARLWDTESGKELRTFKGHSTTVWSVAFSPDGKQVLTGSYDKTARLWDIESGKELRAFYGHSEWVSSVAFAPNGKYVLTGSWDKTARLWDASNGKELRSFTGNAKLISAVAFSPDGKQVLTDSIGNRARLWDAESGKEIRSFKGHSDWVSSVAFAPNGKQVLTGSGDMTARLWDAETGKELHAFKGHAYSVWLAAFSPDGKQIVTKSGDIRLWDAQRGNGLHSISCTEHTGRIVAVAFSPDGKQVLTGSEDKTARLWDAPSGKLLRTFKGHSGEVRSVAFSPDGKLVLTGSGEGNRAPTGSEDETGRLWDAESGKELQCFTGHSWLVTSVAFSANGKEVVTGSWDKTARMWDAETGKELRVFMGHADWVKSVAFAPHGKQVLTGSRDHTARLWDALSGEELRTFTGHSGDITSVAFSLNGKHLLTGSYDQTARLWDAETGKEIRTFMGHLHRVESVAFAPDGKLVLTGSADGTTRIWEAQTGRELCKLISFIDGTWAVVDSEGRFDAANLDEVKGLHWVLPDDPFTPLPPEIFMRDYYEPRLLGRIMAGEKFKPVRDLQSLNRVQPLVQIAKVEPQPGQPDEVIVTVEVANQQRDFDRNGTKVTRSSGVFDLRLFRDGQLVGYHPERDGVVKLDSTTGHAAVRFEHVKLPRKAGLKQVEFSAYAFNEDRVKSQTHCFEYKLPADLAPRQGTAYLVCIGVNAFDNARWDLSYAVADAQAMARVLEKTLKESGQFESVAAVTLLAEARGQGEDRSFSQNTATKENVRNVLAILAGQKVDPKALAQLPAAARALRKAQPEDLVLITFSTHGYNGADGQFYLLPSDIGQGGRTVDKALLQRAISTDELSLWLRDVDAGEMVMIVDACFASASVEQEGFKPGPMGSRGLGQLAYDKRMRILAASQASNPAFEDFRLGHGLLTYALSRDGLDKGAADFDPKDGRITLGEWLKYGAQRVPGLIEDIAAGKIRGLDDKKLTGKSLKVRQDRDLIRIDIEETGPRAVAQLPSLFDFTKGRDDVILQVIKTPDAKSVKP